MRYFKQENSTLFLSGETFSIKDSLKSFGAKWDSSKKQWYLECTEANLTALIGIGFLALSQDVEVRPDTSALLSSVKSTSLEQVWSVKNFVAFVGRIFETYLNDSYWICGEITSYKQSNGHVFFELADSESSENLYSQTKTASISCILWAGKRKIFAEKYPDFTFSDGMKLKLLVHCEFRKETSKLNAIVDDVDVSYTLGALALSKQSIVAELKKRGIYNKNRATKLAVFPLRIALITAQTSRAASDFVDELKKSKYGFQVTIFDANMQGEHTDPDVCSAFKLIQNSLGVFDCVVLTRGGGSRLDLRWFDSLEIAKAIAYCDLPVITAIGHFEDSSVADEVAFLAEKTPTGAARYVVNFTSDNFVELTNKFSSICGRIQQRLVIERQAAARLEQKLLGLVRKKIALEFKNISGLKQGLRLFKVSLTKILERGFALIKSLDNTVLTAASLLSGEYPERVAIVMRSLNGEKTITLTGKIENLEITDTETNNAGE